MSNRYSLNKADKKIAGVCATYGDIFNIDPTILRIGFIAIALMVSWEMALVGYVAAGIYLAVQKNKARGGSRRSSDLDRMNEKPRRASIHDLRTTLDDTDRRLMAIDHHLASQKDHELAREIEALREDK
jgi:phage shock protein PspC (stress-responsive transcriptional regulator)